MRVEQCHWQAQGGWTAPPGRLTEAQLVFVFAGPKLLAEPSSCISQLADAFPSAMLVGCSTAGEIEGTQVLDDSVVATAVHFEQTRTAVAVEPIAGAPESHAVGLRLAQRLRADDLRHVFVLSEGLRLSGSDLVRGFRDALPAEVAVTGGLSGDGTHFERTWVLAGGRAQSDQVVAIGFYGSALRVGFGSLGGWDPFGPKRKITRSEGNVLYELDGRSALALYKSYLGSHAAALPLSALRFPLLVSMPSGHRVVRTVLSVDEATQSMTFAGDVPQGSYAGLMSANVDRLVEGAAEAARACGQGQEGSRAELAILISCVGRRLVLHQRVEQEVEAVRDILGASTTLAGFYSYGEISPFHPGAPSELHNQTMTITTFHEDEVDRAA